MTYQASNDSTGHREKTQPTTVRLPGTLLEEAKELLESGVTGIATMSGLMKDALQTYLKMMRKQQIDLAFLQAAADSQYQRLSREVNAMFAISDRETMFGEKKQAVENRETAAASTRHA